MSGGSGCQAKKNRPATVRGAVGGMGEGLGILGEGLADGAGPGGSQGFVDEVGPSFLAALVEQLLGHQAGDVCARLPSRRRNA